MLIIRHRPWSLVAYYDSAGSQKQLSFEELEAKDLKQAMEMSMTPADQDQDAGISDASGPYFGPAKRAHYEQKNWTMIAPRTHTKEIWLDPEPNDRKRESDAPSFLKPSVHQTKLAALLTVLNSVPIAREALLNREILNPNYGYHEDWWKGTAIRFNKIVDPANDDRVDDRLEVIFEIQRLMAFLQDTNRAYASVEPLEKSRGFTGLAKADVITKFFELWRTIVVRLAPTNPLLDAFRSTVTTIDSMDPQAAYERPIDVIELTIDNYLADQGFSLYDVIDDTIWSGLDEERLNDRFFSEIADVVIIEASRNTEQGSGLGVKIPSTLYFDRYLESTGEQRKEMQAGKLAIRNRIAEIDQQRTKLTNYKPVNGDQRSFDASTLLRVSTEYFERTAENLISNDNGQESATNRFSRIATELKAVADKIMRKLKGKSFSALDW